MWSIGRVEIAPRNVFQCCGDMLAFIVEGKVAAENEIRAGTDETMCRGVAKKMINMVSIFI